MGEFEGELDLEGLAWPSDALEKLKDGRKGYTDMRGKRDS